MGLIVAGPTTGKSTITALSGRFIDAEHEKGWPRKGTRAERAAFIRTLMERHPHLTVLSSWWGQIGVDHPMPERFFFRSSADTVLRSEMRELKGDGVAFTADQVASWHIEKQIENAILAGGDVTILPIDATLSDYLDTGLP